MCNLNPTNTKPDSPVLDTARRIVEHFSALASRLPAGFSLQPGLMTRCQGDDNSIIFDLVTRAEDKSTVNYSFMAAATAAGLRLESLTFPFLTQNDGQPVYILQDEDVSESLRLACDMIVNYGRACDNLETLDGSRRAPPGLRLH